MARSPATLVRPALVAAAAAGAWTALHLRSPAVRAWRPTSLPSSGTVPLAHRVGGPADATSSALLLHGLVATGDVFGQTADRLARDRRVVVPDLLGFGRSLDEARSDFSTEAHLDALDALVDGACPDGPISIGAHSMGSALALRWAARHPDRVERVVCLGAPTWPSPEAARHGLGSLGAMSRAFILDERVARRVCHLNCAHRTLAGVLGALAAPRWPIPISRQSSLHTWPAYHQSLLDQVVGCPWEELLGDLDRAGIPVTLVRGRRDGIGDAAFARAVTDGLDLASLVVVDGDHTLPAAEPDLLVEALAA